MLKGVEETVGVAVCVGVDVAVWSGTVGVDVGVENTVGAGVCVLAGVPVAVGVGSWASETPPITAA